MRQKQEIGVNQKIGVNQEAEMSLDKTKSKALHTMLWKRMKGLSFLNFRKEIIAKEEAVKVLVMVPVMKELAVEVVTAVEDGKGKMETETETEEMVAVEVEAETMVAETLASKSYFNAFLLFAHS